MRYAVVIAKVGKGYTGHVPDVPDCVAAGATVSVAESVVEWLEV